jgi:hypothetical protein
MIRVDDVRGLDFIAISYTWSHSMREWRSRIVSLGGDREYEDMMAKGSFYISSITDSGIRDDQPIIGVQLFFTSVALLVLARGKTFFWMDIICINQDSSEEKEYFVPRMGNLYSNSSETHSYLSGSSLLTTVSCDELYFPIWETMAWTLQEHLMSKTVLFCYCFDGDVRNDLRNRAGTHLPSRTFNIRSPMVERYKWLPRGDGYCVMWEKKRMVTCYMEEENDTGGLPCSYIFDHMFGPQFNRSMGRNTMYQLISRLRHSYTRHKAISTSMIMLGERTSTLPEDMIYSMLGLLEMEDYPVRYGVGFEEARIGVFEAMEPDVLGMTLGTDWGCNRNTKNKDSALPRVVGSYPTIGISLIKTTNYAEYSRDIGTVIYARTERCRIWSDHSRRQSRSLAVTRALMGSQTSRLAIFYCVSLVDYPGFADIQTSKIPEEVVHPIILGDRFSDDEFFKEGFKYDRVAELVEIGICSHSVLLTDPEDLERMKHTALLALECDKTAAGHLTNRGTVLIMDAGGLSGDYSINVVI